MSLFMILIYFLLLIILWITVPMLIRDYVNRKNGDRPILVKHEYNKNAGRFLYELKMTVWHGKIMQRALVCNMRYRLATVDQDEITDEPEPMETLPATPEQAAAANIMPLRKGKAPHQMDEQQNLRQEFWTNATTAEINSRGYKPVERLHDTLLWWRIPQFLMLTDAYKFVVPDDVENYPQHTPATMDNKFKSQSYWKFIKGLFTKVGARDMDAHAIIMVLVLVFGAVAGMWLLGFF